MINFLKKNSGYFAMLLAVIGFGAGPPFVTLALKEFYIIDLLAVRFFIAFLLMVIFCLIMRVDISIKQVGLKPFLMGLLNPFLVTLSFHVGLLLTSPVNGVAIISTLPLMQPFVARIFLKEQIEIKVIIGSFITVINAPIITLISICSFKNILATNGCISGKVLIIATPLTGLVNKSPT